MRKSNQPFGPIARTSNRFKTTKLNPLKMEWTTNKIGATNMKVNSKGSVTPATSEVNATGSKTAFARALFSGFAVWYIAKEAPTNPNIFEMPRASQITLSDNTVTVGSAISAK